ncbi:MAG TPA: TadE family protein [Vicinamibacterales bacterium]|nr:TadE family protein [Vicinamibacterales bacterium]
MESIRNPERPVEHATRGARSANRERGSALLEAAFTIPLLLLVAIGIFEFGRAYQTWQVLTNAAREGARTAVLPSAGADTAQARALAYMQAGRLDKAAEAVITVNENDSYEVSGTTVSASRVRIDYPFSFMVLGPIVQLVVPGSELGGDLTMTAEAVMRNENAI